MRERPMIFSRPMVRAILECRKTQTRRALKYQLSDNASPEIVNGVLRWRYPDNVLRSVPYCSGVCPYGEVGDLLWVRESFIPLTKGYAYRADPIFNDACKERPAWKSPIHMPRVASRITLEITGVAVERLQDVTEEDALAEGILSWAELSDKPGMWDRLSERDRIGILRSKIGSLVTAYSYLWDEINEKRAPWSSNPWVWAITFKRVTP